MAALSDILIADFRARNIGYVFQSFNPILVLSALENVEYPLDPHPPRRESREVAMEKLAAVGLADRAKSRPNDLSSVRDNGLLSLARS